MEEETYCIHSPKGQIDLRGFGMDFWKKARESLSKGLELKALEDKELLDALLKRASRRLVDEAFGKSAAKAAVTDALFGGGFKGLSNEEALRAVIERRAPYVEALVKRAKGLTGIPKALRVLGRLVKDGQASPLQFTNMVRNLGFDVTEEESGGSLIYVVQDRGVEVARFKF